MPNKDKIILFMLGVVIVAAVFAVRTQSQISSFNATDQDPINPAALTGEFDDSQISGVFHESEVSVENIENQLAEALAEEKTVLGTNDDAEENKENAEQKDYKRIEVDLTNQKVYAIEGDRVVYDFLISSGKWGRTPTGEFRIWGKFKYTKMSGGSKELNTYYYLPNVPFVMFFSNNEIAASRGFSFHGTYWHENFGEPMSHGCINMRTGDALKLFLWTSPGVEEDENAARASKDEPGTLVSIYGVAPK